MKPASSIEAPDELATPREARATAGARARWIDRVTAAWGLVGVLVLLLDAVYRLGRVAYAGLRGPLGTTHVIALAASLVVLGYVEGVRAFHRSFSPRVALRVYALAQGAPRRYRFVAPLFCMALVGASRRRLVANWLVVLMVIALVLSLRLLPLPLRAVVDAGVAFALSIGTASVLYFTARTFAGAPPKVAIDLPDEGDWAVSGEGVSAHREQPPA